MPCSRVSSSGSRGTRRRDGRGKDEKFVAGLLPGPGCFARELAFQRPREFCLLKDISKGTARLRGVDPTPAFLSDADSQDRRNDPISSCSLPAEICQGHTASQRLFTHICLPKVTDYRRLRRERTVSDFSAQCFDAGLLFRPKDDQHGTGANAESRPPRSYVYMSGGCASKLLSMGATPGLSAGLVAPVDRSFFLRLLCSFVLYDPSILSSAAAPLSKRHQTARFPNPCGLTCTEAGTMS